MKRFTDHELEVMLDDMESDRAERKESFGRGIAIAAREMKENGNPEPIFETNQSAVVCTLWGKK